LRCENQVKEKYQWKKIGRILRYNTIIKTRTGPYPKPMKTSIPIPGNIMRQSTSLKNKKILRPQHQFAAPRRIIQNKREISG
jgi:hypothetical protein